MSTNLNKSTEYELQDGKKTVTIDTSTLVLVNCVFNIPLMLISVIGNSLVLVAVITNSSLRSTSTILLCGLAVSDLLVGLIVQPFYIAKELNSTEFLQFLTATMAFAFCGVSFATMALISVDRFMALRFHLNYSNVVTSPRVIFSLIVVWIVHLLLLNKFWVPPKYIYVGFVLVFIYIMAATVSYIGIYRIVRRHQVVIHVQQKAVQSSNATTTLNFLSLRRAALNTFVFYICTILCYFPWCIYRLFYGDIFITNKKTAWIFTITLVFANSSINPFLYGWRLRELRQGVVKTLRKMFGKKSVGNRRVPRFF